MLLSGDLQLAMAEKILLTAGADLGGGGRSLSGIRPSADPKGPPFVLFRDIYSWRADPKIFLKAPLPKYILILRGSARRNNAIFWSNSIEKVPKNAFLAYFFKTLPAAQKICLKPGIFSAVLGKSIC